MPLARCCSTNAMRTMAFVTTMPMRSRAPIIAGSPSERPVIASATNTPMSASGSVVTMTNGFRSEPRLTTMTR